MNSNKISNVGEMVTKAITNSKPLKEGILKAEWEKIVGKFVDNSQPEYIKDGILTITVEGHAFMHHFMGKKDEYIEKINSYFGSELVRDLDIRSGKIDENREEYLDREEEEQPQLKRVEKKEKINAFDTSEVGIIREIAKLQELAREREEYLLAHGCKKCKGCGVIFEVTDPEEDVEFCKVCLTAKKDRKKQNF